MYEWADPPKSLLGLGFPCNDNDRDIFAAATKVMVGDGILLGYRAFVRGTLHPRSSNYLARRTAQLAWLCSITHGPARLTLTKACQWSTSRSLSPFGKSSLILASSKEFRTPLLGNSLLMGSARRPLHKDWWIDMASMRSQHWKAISCLMMLCYVGC